MPFFTFNNIRISGIASAVPTQVVKVKDFVELYGHDVIEKFIDSTGINQFRKTSKYQTASDLGFVAAEMILNDKSIDRDSIGALVFVAHSTDYRRPATACVLHKRLKLSKNCAAYDVGLGCSAFVYGLQTVCSMMQCSDIQRALLIVGESLTKMIYPSDKSVSMLFGDGGAACLLEKTNLNSTISGILQTDGSGYRAIIAPAGGFRNINASHDVFVWPDGNQRTLYNTVMKGDDVFGFTISDVPKTVKTFLEKTGTTAEDYDCLAFHQANQFISKMLCKKLKVSSDKMPLCLDRYGNTSAPAIPLVICDKYGNENEDSDLRFLMCGFGVGLSWGVCSANINKKDIYPIIETDDFFEEGIINTPKDLDK